MEDKLIEVIQSGKGKEKKEWRQGRETEQNSQNMWHNIIWFSKLANTVPEGGKWIGEEDMFQEIMTKHFPKLMEKKWKNQEAQETLRKINCDILVKLLKKKS